MDIHSLEKNKVFEVPTKVETNPIVSVIILAYNHEPFIRQCLEGVLDQVTDFSFEIIIGEDESRDGTRAICLEYAQKFPYKIRLFLHSRENIILINNRPTGRFNFIYNLFSSKGRYIALCDGDDYWTDRNKLQKQVKFLEDHTEFVACGHPTFAVKGGGNITESIIGNFPNEIFTYESFSKGYKRIPTASLVFRNIITDLPPFFNMVYGGDRALLYILSQRGKIKIMDFVGAVYRIHNGGREGSDRENWSKKRQLAIRNIDENKVYLNIIEVRFKSILARKIRWNYFYLFLLSIKQFKLLDALSIIPHLLRFQLVVMGIHKVIPKN